MKTKIAPSILSADFGRLNEDIKTIEPFSDLIHVDVMDGHFVPNLTIGPCVVRSIQTKLPLDVHLMISEPERYIEAFAKAGADYITVHSEVNHSLLKLIKQIKKYGLKAGVSLNPDTGIDCLVPYLRDIDLVLIMSVFPGFGGQKFIPDVLEKIRLLASARKIHRAKSLEISVDGGINQDTAEMAREAGADILVAGSYIFKAEDRKQAINSLRGHSL